MFRAALGSALVVLLLSQVSLQLRSHPLVDEAGDDFSDEIAALSIPDTVSRRGLKAGVVTIGYTARDGPLSVRVPAKTADASALFQKAINLVGSAKASGLTILAGTYTLSKQIVWPYSNSFFEGVGMGATILKFANKAKDPPTAGFWRATKIKSVVVRKITFDGNKAGQNQNKEPKNRYCIFTANYTDLTFDLVECKNWQQYGFDPHGIKTKDNNPKKSIWSFGLKVVNCISHDNNWDGFTLDQTIGIYVNNCTSYDNGRYGFNIVTGSENVLIENSVARNNGFGAKLPDWKFDGGDGCGFVIDTNKPGFNTKNVTIRNCQAIRSYRAGFCVKDSGDILITNNVIVGDKKIASLKPPGDNACGNWKRVKKVDFVKNRCSGYSKQFTSNSSPGGPIKIEGNTFIP